ncbi:hypothetical protein L1049_006081 [Liquidambar formosana]|uniref:Uncharacterized protein n=1 Tax=Liquidambar formosana TaxID=63359 RepID=A0AAP0WQJ3_LIQFO
MPPPPYPSIEFVASAVRRPSSPLQLQSPSPLQSLPSPLPTVTTGLRIDQDQRLPHQASRARDSTLLPDPPLLRRCHKDSLQGWWPHLSDLRHMEHCVEIGKNKMGMYFQIT